MITDVDKGFLNMALDEAKLALQDNTYPVGAVLVDEEFNVIATGRNRVHPNKDVSAHAEIEAIRNAGEVVFDAKIHNKKFTLYSSLEPCPMCTGGILFAKIQRVVWLLNDDKGFGGFLKMKDAAIFEEKFNRIEVIAEPDEELKMKQIELMDQWEKNANHVGNLRKVVLADI
ncbi:nucleoside deaminase [Sporosarcina thermotolerans]|uniref:Nucleoside deaminase n=1 Tax=Sporosarcina thermotolerans TaxID=633404 RepID=A0AAW9AF65_9BACL|nr:nucleoside deaminase [Sporosarcina thermotolerans]MDW0117701.1 nucleoside deaminase [Sporosarcina thermotolerans]WHT49211.1 nucleoside deaminase [Sporosarcina thermotolerans]